ncbi:MAG: hypothetical protein KIT62_08095 [Cyclobacteriaceae bacterium]|nr:hypothetical protein [Cyclobacteriaceae bacterium]
MLKSILLIAYVMFPVLSGATGSFHTVYYTSLAFVETPLSKIKGANAVSKEVALTRNHYRFEYDVQNRLISVGFYNGHIPKDPNETANFFFLSSRQEIRYNGNKEIITFYDKHGNRAKVLGNVSQFLYELDENGYRKALFFLSDQRKKIENSWKISKYKWEGEYGTGAVIETRYNKEGTPASIRPGFEFYKTRFIFNQYGNIALMQNMNERGQLMENNSGAAQDYIETTAEGLFIAWNVLDKNGNLEKGNSPDIARGVQEFDSFGNEIVYKGFDEKGNLIYNSFGICQSRTEYDSFGNTIYRIFYDENANPTAHKLAGYVSAKFIWDNTGNQLLSTEYYDLAGNLTNHLQRGYAIAKTEYDDKNNRVSITYFDKDNNPVSRTDNGISRIEFRYDEKGILVERITY